MGVVVRIGSVVSCGVMNMRVGLAVDVTGGVVWCGGVLCGVVWCAVLCCGVVWCGVECVGIA